MTNFHGLSKQAMALPALTSAQSPALSDPSNGMHKPYAGSGFAPRPNDPGIPIEKIYISNEPDTNYAGIIDKLREIGSRRGFVVDDGSSTSRSLAPNFRWIRDPSILMRNPESGEFSLLTSTVTGEQFRAAKNNVQRIYGNENGSNAGTSLQLRRLGALDDLGGSFSGEYTTLSQRVATNAREAGWALETTLLAIDGGNMLMTSNKAGDPVAVVGKNTILVNWQILKDAGKLNHPEAQRQIQKIIDQRQYDGALAIEFRVASTRQVSGRSQNPNSTAQAAQNPTQSSFGLEEKDAIRMAAEFEYTRRQIATTLNLPLNGVISIEQVGFHIDMETRPLGNGRMMVSDLNESMAVLKAAIDEERRHPSVPPGVKNETLDYLVALQGTTQATINNGGQILLDRKAKTLSDAGFIVVRAPINYGGIGRATRSDDKFFDVNFANGIAAKDKNGNTYLITNQSTIGSGNALERIFIERMKALGIAVEWVPSGKALNDMGGINCLTKEAIDPYSGQFATIA